MQQKPPGKTAESLKALLSELSEEVEEDRIGSMSNEEKVLSEVARKILRLERDMTMSGSRVSDSQRVERLAQFISDEEF
jgi:hypothetical protein